MENPFSDVSFVRNAIMTLYNQGPGHHEANLFLIEFETRDEAWQTLITILSEDFLTTQSDQFQEGVAYFSANILYSKVCKHWKQLPLEMRPELGNMMMRILATIVQSPNMNVNNALLGRLCMILCAVSIRSPIGGVSSVVEQILVFGETGETVSSVRVCLEILKTFTDEVDNADISRPCKIELYDELAKERTRVINLISMIVAHVCENIVVSSNDTEISDFKLRGKLALEALRNWIHLTPSISLGDFNEYGAHDLLARLFQLISGNLGADLAIHSANALDALLESFEGDEMSESYSGAYCGLKSALLSTRPMLEATAESVLSANGSEEAEDAAHAVSLLIVRFVSKFMNWICGVNAGQESIEVMNLLLLVTGHPLRRLCLLTVDTWLELSDMSPSERHPYFQQEIHVKLLESLVQQCAYPNSYSGDWDDVLQGGVDEFIFKEVRGDSAGVSGCSDALIQAYHALNIQYFHILAPKLGTQGPVDWQLAESSLFAMSSVMKEVVRYLQVTAQAPARASERLEFMGLLLGLVQHLCLTGDDILRQHPLLLKQGSKLLGSFHSILRLDAEPSFMIGLEHAKPAVQEAASLAAQSANQGEAPPSLMPVLNFLNAGLSCQLSTSEAAKGIKNICVGNKEQVALLIVRSGGDILNSCLVSSATSGGEHADRLALVEGFTRVIASMVSDPSVILKLSNENPSLFMKDNAGGVGNGIVAAAGSAMLSFCEPMLQVIKSSIESSLSTGSNLNEENEKLLCESLDLIGTIVQFLDVPIETSHDGSVLPHVASLLVESLLPLMRALLSNQILAMEERVVAAGFKCYGKLLLNLTPLVISELSPLIDLIATRFSTNYWSSCLDCVAVVVEALGDAEQFRTSFYELLKHLTMATANRLSSAGHEPRQEPSLVQGFFHLCKQFIIFAPSAALLGSALGENESIIAKLIELSVACLSCISERDSARSVLSFLSTIFVTMETKPGGNEMISNAMTAVVLPAASIHGEQLMHGLVGALLGGAPSILRESLTECLASVMQALTLSKFMPLGIQTRAWFVSTLSSSLASNLDAGFRDRVLEACEAYTSALHHQGSPASPPSNGRRNPPDKKAGMKRKLKIVLRDLASVCAGEANCDDCIYDLNDL